MQVSQIPKYLDGLTLYHTYMSLMVSNWPKLAIPGQENLDTFNYFHPLRKHAYSNLLKILSPNIEHFQIKNSDIFHMPKTQIVGTR